MIQINRYPTIRDVGPKYSGQVKSLTPALSLRDRGPKSAE